jgi:hypothetical protein
MMEPVPVTERDFWIMSACAFSFPLSSRSTAQYSSTWSVPRRLVDSEEDLVVILTARY